MLSSIVSGQSFLYVRRSVRILVIAEMLSKSIMGRALSLSDIKFKAYNTVNPVHHVFHAAILVYRNNQRANIATADCTYSFIEWSRAAKLATELITRNKSYFNGQI